MENDIDSDIATVIPLHTLLAKCSNILADGDSSTSNVENELGECSYSSNDFSKPSTSKTSSFQVCQDTIPCVPNSEQEDGLLGLGVSVYDQNQFESEVMDQVDKAMKEHDEKKRKEEVQRELKTVAEDIKYDGLNFFRFVLKYSNRFIQYCLHWQHSSFHTFWAAKIRAKFIYLNIYWY